MYRIVGFLIVIIYALLPFIGTFVAPVGPAVGKGQVFSSVRSCQVFVGDLLWHRKT